MALLRLAQQVLLWLPLEIEARSLRRQRELQQLHRSQLRRILRLVLIILVLSRSTVKFEIKSIN